jgi:hypothetical protein
MIFGLEQHFPFLIQSLLLILQGINLLAVDIFFDRAFLEALLCNLEIFFLIVRIVKRSVLIDQAIRFVLGLRKVLLLNALVTPVLIAASSRS